MGFFKSVGNFFSNVAAPIALSFIPGTIPGLGLALGPVLAATYSGIKTGVETGSPLAGIGSAAMSFGLSEIGRGIRGVDTAAKTGSGAIGRSVIEPSSSYIVEGGKLISRPASVITWSCLPSTPLSCTLVSTKVSLLIPFPTNGLYATFFMSTAIQ